MTRQNVDDLGKHFHQPRAVVVCHIMQWGLTREQTVSLDPGEAQGPVRHLSLYVESELHEQVAIAATAAGVRIVWWLRHMVRQITMTDFPASWQEERAPERSHDSRTYDTRFMLRSDHLTRQRLEDLSTQFNMPASEVIRHLIAQAKPEDFQKSWHMKAAERRTRQTQQKGPTKDRERTR